MALPYDLAGLCPPARSLGPCIKLAAYVNPLQGLRNTAPHCRKGRRPKRPLTGLRFGSRPSTASLMRRRLIYGAR